jgi:hypothetical protein
VRRHDREAQARAAHGHRRGPDRLGEHAALEATARAIADGPKTAFEVVPIVHGEQIGPANAAWWLSETLCYLQHLEVEGRARRDGGDPERWVGTNG